MNRSVDKDCREMFTLEGIIKSFDSIELFQYESNCVERLVAV